MASTRLVILLMVLCAIVFGVRAGGLVRDLSSGERSNAKGGAHAAASALDKINPAAGLDSPAAPPQDDLTGAGDQLPAATGRPKIEAPTLGAPPPATSAERWRGAEDVDDDYADVRMEMFSDLSQRRRDIEAREREMVMREALLKAAQAELQQKTKELTTIREEIEELLTLQTKQEDERIASLVKIYEGMKAKDAANIFNALDMDVLIQVLTKMSERKSAPIIAAMNEDRARTVTIMLAEQNKLPSLPALPMP